MELITYERPREKIRNNGVQFLALVELLQVIIGSGTVKYSSARLARRVKSLVLNGTVTYEELVAIKGVGDAKACQILAAVEVGRRLAIYSNKNIEKRPNITPFIEEARFFRSSTLTCYWFNGSDELIDKKTYELELKQFNNGSIKRIYSDIVAVSARSVLFVFTTKQASSLTPSRELALIKALKDTAHILQVQIIDIYGVNKKSSKKWTNEV